MRERGDRLQGPDEERRNGPRLPASAIAGFKGARIVAGPEVKLINISRGGALIEGCVRFLPGASLLLRLVCGAEILHIKGTVQRSKASALSGSVLLYQAAICFESEFPVAERRGSLVAQSESERGGDSHGAGSAEPFILALTADCTGLDYNLSSILEMNKD